MAQHTRPRRTLGQWMTDDLQGWLGPRRAARLIRREPVLLAWLLVPSALVMTVVSLLLSALGQSNMPNGIATFLTAMVGYPLGAARMRAALAKHPDLQRNSTELLSDTQ